MQFLLEEEDNVIVTFGATKWETLFITHLGKEPGRKGEVLLKLDLYFCITKTAWLQISLYAVIEQL